MVKTLLSHGNQCKQRSSFNINHLQVDWPGGLLETETTFVTRIENLFIS
jgi:hypothetical protein